MKTIKWFGVVALMLAGCGGADPGAPITGPGSTVGAQPGEDSATPPAGDSGQPEADSGKPGTEDAGTRVPDSGEVADAGKDAESTAQCVADFCAKQNFECGAVHTSNPICGKTAIDCGKCAGDDTCFDNGQQNKCGNACTHDDVQFQQYCVYGGSTWTYAVNTTCTNLNAGPGNAGQSPANFGCQHGNSGTLGDANVWCCQ